MKWNDLKAYCKKHNYSPEDVLRLIKRYNRSGYFRGKKDWKMTRFRMYAHERIKMKNDLYRGSKKDAVSNIVSTPEFQNKFKESIYGNLSYDHAPLLTQLISEPRQHRDLKKAFQLEGSQEII